MTKCQQPQIRCKTNISSWRMCAQMFSWLKRWVLLNDCGTVAGSLFCTCAVGGRGEQVMMTMKACWGTHILQPVRIFFSEWHPPIQGDCNMHDCSHWWLTVVCCFLCTFTFILFNFMQLHRRYKLIVCIKLHTMFWHISWIKSYNWLTPGPALLWV